MPLLRLLFIALPFMRRALRNPDVRRRLGMKPLTRKQIRQQRRQTKKSARR